MRVPCKSLILIAVICLNAYIVGAVGTVKIVFEPVFNGKPLKLSTQPYVNEHGDTLFVDLLKFYVTDVTLSSGIQSSVDANRHLMDAGAWLYFYIGSMKSGDYSDLDFVVGVDSIMNTNGANAADLDPAREMYWAWNSGYIMAKLEGHSDKCKTLHHAFEFHIGGFQPPYDAERTVHLKLPKKISVKDGSSVTITIEADADAWFSGGVDLAKVNSIVTPGKDATMMADRYAKMFRIKEIKTE